MKTKTDITVESIFYICMNIVNRVEGSCNYYCTEKLECGFDLDIDSYHAINIKLTSYGVIVYRYWMGCSCKFTVNSELEEYLKEIVNDFLNSEYKVQKI